MYDKDRKIIKLSNGMIIIFDKDNIRFFIEQLPEKYKVVLILFYFENMKTVEISNLLDISEAAVRKRLERARDILKKKMEAYNG